MCYNYEIWERIGSENDFMIAGNVLQAYRFKHIADDISKFLLQLENIEYKYYSSLLIISFLILSQNEIYKSINKIIVDTIS